MAGIVTRADHRIDGHEVADFQIGCICRNGADTAYCADATNDGKGNRIRARVIVGVDFVDVRTVSAGSRTCYADRCRVLSM